jgi:hypothetical protein
LVGRVKVETSPTDVGALTVPTGVPPLHGVHGALSWHKVKATDPVGAPQAALPVTVAASFQELPTVVFIGAITVVVSVGVAVAGQTVKHSLSLCCHTEE